MRILVVRRRQMQPTKVTKAYMMAAAYCSTFGGTGTLVGTGTNLTFKGIYESTFPESGGMNFTQWMLASVPQMIVNTALTWLYLRIVFMGYLRPGSEEAQMANIGEEGEAVTNRVIFSVRTMKFFEHDVHRLRISRFRSYSKDTTNWVSLRFTKKRLPGFL